MLAVSAHAEWGELGHFGIPVGTGANDVNFHSSFSTLAFATDSADSSYYIGDEPKSGEFRIQRFVEGKAEASISFVPPEAKKAHDGVGETGVGLELAVDPGNNRVYALVLYERRSASEAEEKELEKEEKELEKEGKHCEPPAKSCWERFPLDSEEVAAGELYAFEATESGKKLVSAKENTEHLPVPVVGETTAETSTTAFADQSEQAKVALLNPRGLTVDPNSGDVVILGDEDEEANEEVEKENSEKQCRMAAQVVIPEVKSGKLGGKAKLGHRYVDKADALRPDISGCQPEEVEEVPLSPVVTPASNLLVYSGAQGEGQIWEVLTPGLSSGEGEQEVTPTLLYGEHQLTNFLNLEPPAEGAGPVMSFVPEKTSEGTLYLSIEGFEHEPLPLVLHYAESADKSTEVSNVGWAAGGAHEACAMPSPDNFAAAMGAGHERVLVLDAYLEEQAPRAPHVETFAFGPGGNTNGCPKASVTTPAMIVGLSQNATEARTHEPVTLYSELEGADAKSVKWELKYKDTANGEEGTETVEQTSAQLRNHAGEYEFVPLQYEFEHAGAYEISEVVQSDDLADESVAAPETLKVLVTALTPILKPTAPKAVRVNEEEATLSVTVEDPNASEKPKLHLKKVKWEFGDGSPVKEEAPGELSNPTELKVKHKFISRCKNGKCKIKLSVEDTAAEGTPAVTNFEITVQESHAEELQHQKEAEEAANKQAEEAQHQREAEAAAAAAKQHQAEEEAAKKAAEEAAAHKKAEEEAAAKKHKEEEKKAKKAPTRAQLLAAALKKCKKGPKSKRAKCEAAARKKYGKKKRKKK